MISRLRSVLDLAATLAMVCAAAVMVGLHLHDRRARNVLAAGSDETEMIEDWEEINAGGIRMGPSAADIVITEFIDFQCPYCAKLVPRIDSLIAEYAGNVAVVVQHYPLTQHPQAIPAAIAAECAYRQDRFTAMYRSLFTHQRFLGSKPWNEYGEVSGVPDLRRFMDCMELPVDSFPRIAFGRAAGARTGVRATPTVWVNGLRVVVPDLESLRTFVKAALER